MLKKRIYFDVLILCVFGLGVCFVVSPDLPLRYNSYLMHRFVPNEIWALAYLLAAARGQWAVQKKQVQAWEQFGYASIALFGFSCSSAIIAFFVANGSPTAVALHSALLIQSFLYCKNPDYWMLVIRRELHVADR